LAMKISIHGQDYTAALDGSKPLTIERKLNEPSVCRLLLSLPTDGSLPTPTRNQALQVTGDDETAYFTGYIAVSPLPEYAGLGLEGPQYRIAIQAISDELLLDQLPARPNMSATGITAAGLLTALVTHTGSGALSTQALSLNTPVAHFYPEPGAPWSKCAGQAANMARAAYRAENGALSIAAVPAAVHGLSETDGRLSLANLSLTAGVDRAAANDVTVCGELEPAAYVTEYILGDGATTQFSLAAEPFFPATSKSTIIREHFDETVLNQQVWSATGDSGCLKLGQGGLVMDGGAGIDGQTVVSWLDAVEMGGTLLLEAVGVTLCPGSTGILAGFFVGLNTQAACIAGFQATAQQGTGAVSLQPLIQGSVAGAAYPVSPANQYTLRLRVHCAEQVRALAIYRSFGDNGAIAFGGQTNVCPGKLQLEVQPFVNGVAGMPVTLYDGAIGSLPVSCALVAASSLNLIGTMRAINLTNLGSGWVVSTPPSGNTYSRRLGTTAEAAECHLERSGKLVFSTGAAPVSGEKVAVSYRTVARAVGRAVNTASQQSLAQAGLPSVNAWIGSVSSPAARCSADCRNAAMAIEQASAGVSALWSGTYSGNSMSFAGDVWPGDALLLNAPSCNLDAQVVVRGVKLSYRASVPDLVEYAIAFANDWACDLAIKTTTTVPADAWLPAAIAPTLPANLTGLIVTSVNGTSVAINTGVTPPSGGGFEIRRRDFAFMAGEDPGLVLRANLPNMTFSRETANDRFYIRMYDGSTPPNYSEFSTALFINLPLGS